MIVEWFLLIPNKTIPNNLKEEMWKKVGKGEEAWANKACLVTSLDIEWKELNHGALVKFLNIFVIKGFEIYFGRKGIM